MAQFHGFTVLICLIGKPDWGLAHELLYLSQMLGVLKKFFSRSNRDETDYAPTVDPVIPPPAPRYAAKPAPAPAPYFPPPALSTPPEIAGDPADSLIISISQLLPQLPPELHGRNASASAAQITVPIPRQQVLDQLGQGAVRIPFGSLRRLCPAGLFANTSSQDNRLIDLPLGAILPQLEPETYGRRPDQRQFVSPPEIANLFGRKGESASTVRILPPNEVLKPNAANGAVTAKPVSVTPKPPSAPIRMRTSPEMPRPTTPEPISPPKEKVVRLAVADILEEWPEPVRLEIRRLDLISAICEFPQNEIMPALKQGRICYPWGKVAERLRPPIDANVLSPGNVEMLLEIPLAAVAAAAFQQQNQPAATPAPKPPSAERIASTPPAPRMETALPPAAPVPMPHAAATIPLPKVAGPTISIPVSTATTLWPEPLREALAKHGVETATLTAPKDVLECKLKQGKVICSWKEICNWLPECPPTLTAATPPDTRLELPLPVIAPLFFKQAPRNDNKKPAFAMDVPDVFNPKGAEVPAAAAEPSAPPAPAPTPTTPATTVTERPPRNLAELFAEPNKRSWTPKEIVQKTCGLPGIQGAIMTLHDGLLVAANMPPNWRTDLVSAFLPQIFGRMNQYSHELQTGDLESVTLTMQQGTLQIFRAGLVFFAVLGATGSLPLAQLRLIASELNRHTQ